ncbi:MAG: hypothetical protein K2X37_10265 [Chitinophagaceae bacterium]|jgi:hypothetical protein|nr:hypothetical protein [Chitinophagaceae bacterium]
MASFLKEHPSSTAIEKISFCTVNGNIVAHDFSWEEEHEEFSWKGDWYDVLSFQQVADTLHIYVVKDGKETNLLKAFAHTQQMQGKNKKWLGSKFSFFIATTLCKIPQLHYARVPYTAEKIMPKVHGSYDEIYKPPKNV